MAIDNINRMYEVTTGKNIPIRLKNNPAQQEIIDTVNSIF